MGHDNGPTRGLLILLVLQLLAIPTWAADFQINTYTTGPQRLPALAKDADGNFIVVWDDGDAGQGVRGQRYDSTGVPQAVEFRIDAGLAAASDPAVAMNADGDFVVAWRGEDGDYSGIKARRFDGAGIPQGAEFQVNSYTTDRQLYPAVAMDAVGNFTVAWQNAFNFQNIRAQRFDNAGGPLGAEFEVSSGSTPSVSPRPHVAMDADGDFVIVWHDVPVGGSRILAQRFDAGGTPLDVPSNVSSAGSYPAVAMDADGGFIVAWEDFPSLSTGFQVFARRFDSAGMPVGTSFQVSTVDGAFKPAAAFDVDGDFALVWETFGGIQIQRFDADGSPLGTQFKVNSQTHGGHPAVAMADDTIFVVWEAGDSTGSDSDSNSIQGAFRPGQPPACPAAPALGCEEFDKATLVVREAVVGRERLFVNWRSGPALMQSDFGNPLDFGGTAYATCIYDDAGTLIAQLRVDRAAERCGKRLCWLPLTRAPSSGGGFQYLDLARTADGVQSIVLDGRAAGRSFARVIARNNAKKSQLDLPVGVAAALEGSAGGATVQLHGRGIATCLSASLLNVVRNDGSVFKARK